VEEPFFPFPAGIRVTALDDQRPGRPRQWSHTALSRLPSLLVHPGDGAAHRCNAWMDAMLVRHLSGRTGFLIGTRPGFNLLAASMRRPTLRAIGQEHIHFGVQSRLVRRDIRRHYPKLDALAVLTARDAFEYGNALGADVDVFEIPNSAKVTGPRADLTSQVVLAAGRLRREKGFDLLITAFALVHRDRPSWRLRICGSGHLRRELRAQAVAEGLADVVELPGRRDLSDEMARASIFALSSRFEGFPIVLLEAMRKGMAVVSFDCPTGPRELIDDHQNGILVPVGDTAALAAGIVELIDDDDLRRRCAAAAELSAQRYSPEEIGARWETLLADVAKRTAAA
jgi:glycosyltransferase involved in cell wall biosynthesis